jgi:Asp-tRNA(Asn)/Glu-tRNA(Gln) amidotransferase A subunit family amidase
MLCVASRAAAQTPFHLEEATISTIRAAFAGGQLTCTQIDEAVSRSHRGLQPERPVTARHHHREPASDGDGGRNGRQYRANRASVGALHCIPLVLKDNFNTADMPTTGGNVSMKNSRPTSDAFTVAKLRKAGALILGKANLQEFARGGMSKSSLGGQVLNPYDLTRTPAARRRSRRSESRPISRWLAPAATPANRSARRHPPTIWSACVRRAGLSAAAA